MKITIKKDEDMIIIEEGMEESTIKYNADKVILVIESAIESLTKERNNG